MKIAQRFNAGIQDAKRVESRQGRKNRSFVPNGTNTHKHVSYPALKRWATINRIVRSHSLIYPDRALDRVGDAVGLFVDLV
jgi:hypothetical protein